MTINHAKKLGGAGAKRTLTREDKRGVTAFVDQEEGSEQARTYFPCSRQLRFRKPEDEGKHLANCTVCKVHVERPDNFVTRSVRDDGWYKQDGIKFPALIKDLLPPSPGVDLEGCEIRFPDTAFFAEDGKPGLHARMDKDGKLSQVAQTNKLTLNAMNFDLVKIVRERQKDAKTVQEEWEREKQRLHRGQGAKDGAECCAHAKSKAKEKKAKHEPAGYAKSKGSKGGDGADGAAQTVADKQSAATDAVVVRFRDKADGTQVLTGARFL